MEVDGHRELLKGLLLVSSDLFDGRRGSQVTEVEFWCKCARHRSTGILTQLIRKMVLKSSDDIVSTPMTYW